jgi:beta-N-acetylhexosaminidase
MRKTRYLALLLAATAMLAACKPMPAPTPTPAAAATPTPEPTPVPTPRDELLETVRALDDRALIGQMVMVGFEGPTAPSDDLVRLMEDYGVGNIILFGWNIKTFEQTGALVSGIEAHNPLPGLPMLIATDVEGGLVTRFKWSPTIKSAYLLGRAKDEDAVYAQYKRIGEGLRGCGITVDLAPVMDIAKTLEGTFLNDNRRMFGSDAALVARLVAAAVKGLQDGGVLSFGKHFPGHGNTAVDSHEALPTLYATRQSWDGYERKPFEAAIAQGIDGMLVGHMSYPNFDGRITSLSPVIIGELLRTDMGFEGVIMSDDMRMRAVSASVGVGEAAVRFVEAGGDLVLIGRYTNRQEAVLNALYDALQSGRLSRERCEQSVYRILAARKSLVR